MASVQVRQVVIRYTYYLFFWFIIYESPDKHKKVSRAELEYINSDIENDNKSENEKVKWITLLKYKQTWSFIVGKFLTDPVWWFYLFWLPSFLNKQYGMTKTEVALPIAIVYTMTTFGSIFGGWLSGRLITSGWQIYKARKISLLIFALCVVPVILAQELGKYNPWFAVLIVGLAASSHQAWSANLFTTVSDMFPKKAVASVTGIGGMTGAIGGILISFCTGLILDYYKSIGNIDIGYYIMFIFCGLAYILAWIIFTILSPKMEVVKI